MMMEHISAVPYIFHINEHPVQTIHLTEQIGSLGAEIDPIMQELTTLNPTHNPQVFVETSDDPIEIVHKEAQPINQNIAFTNHKEQPCVVQIVYSQELNLNPACNVVKRGRPKKKKSGEKQMQNKSKSPPKEIVAKPPNSPRTRSGRLVKLPKHIERDFKKIEITADDHELQVSDFKRFEEKENSKKKFTELHTKKRTISSQYKCPKCLKAYLGKNKMIDHLKKYPDHGPLPEGCQEFNFDVWNYLYDITQKCKAGQRGIKFCEELSNLLHNVQLLKSALFKTVTDSKNCVQIDKVLGNAIGLTPGKYKFDENELYKDVTVLKLITNSDFFKPNVNKQSNEPVVGKTSYDDMQLDHSENKKRKQDNENFSESFILESDNQNKSICLNVTGSDHNLITNAKQNDNMYHSNNKFANNENTLKMEESPIDKFTKKVEVDNQMSLHSELLTENLLLHSLPNPRNSVDELILTSVDSSTNLLDNSTSSDDVMNVDQFVNERFKKIIEPDIELGTTSLNLDLPSLELFHFHTS